MYEPIANFIQRRSETFIEEELLRATQEMGLDVDREELLKALKYDRGQYEKGYADGCRDSRKQARWIDSAFCSVKQGKYPVVTCSECEMVFCDFISNHHYLYHYCPYCGAKMDGGNEE